MNSNVGNNKVFFNRLTSIVESYLEDENFGVSELAQEIGLSRSQLYFRVKSDTGKSVSQFIREIRLNKALQMLKQPKLTVSEVSYQVGFSSPAYFNKCFHDYFGYPPGEVKKHAEVESDLEEGTEESKPKKNEVPKQSSKLILPVVTLLVLLGAFFVYHSFFNYPTQKNLSVKDKSIAVLPLKNLSNNTEIQYLADGIMEDILSRLSQVDGLVVKSRISSEKIGDENLTAREIAKELNVDYFLEGSIIPENDKIRINVQLISAKEDKHVWANHFDKELTEILPFITGVSGEITDQLEIIISPEEKEQVEKIYTENKEAYKLYLEGRFYYQLRTKESFEKSIELYNQALALDSVFCLAYAGLADSYITSTWYGFIPKEKGVPMSRTFALRALKIDNNLAEAHATLGAIATYFDFDWNTAERELNKALKINPNYARAYKLYSEFMDVIGNSEMARRYIDNAKLLNPSYDNLYSMSWHSYLWGGDLDKAMEESNKLYFLNRNEVAYYWRNFQVRLLQDRMPEAVEAYIKYWKVTFPNNDTSFIEDIYMKTGKEGFIRFVASAYKKNVGLKLDLVELYALLNEKDSTIMYLEKLFEAEEAKRSWIKCDPFLKDLKTDPRFIALLRKMNLADE